MKIILKRPKPERRSEGKYRWNDGMDEMLRGLADQQLSYARIAEMISATYQVPISVSAVIGRAHRLKISKPKIVERKPPVVKKPPETFKRTRRKEEPKLVEYTRDLYPGEPVSIGGQIRETRHTCAYIRTDPTVDQEWQYCGAPTDGKAWCAYHRALVYRKAGEE